MVIPLGRIRFIPCEGPKAFVNWFLRKRTMKVELSSQIMEQGHLSWCGLHDPWCKPSLRYSRLGSCKIVFSNFILVIKHAISVTPWCKPSLRYSILGSCKVAFSDFISVMKHAISVRWLANSNWHHVGGDGVVSCIVSRSMVSGFSWICWWKCWAWLIRKSHNGVGWARRVVDQVCGWHWVVPSLASLFGALFSNVLLWCVDYVEEGGCN
jgi:hypothetical protein